MKKVLDLDFRSTRSRPIDVVTVVGKRSSSGGHRFLYCYLLISLQYVR